MTNFTSTLAFEPMNHTNGGFGFDAILQGEIAPCKLLIISSFIPASLPSGTSVY
jgi:hypothetical protein